MEQPSILQEEDGDIGTTIAHIEAETTRISGLLQQHIELLEKRISECNKEFAESKQRIDYEHKYLEEQITRIKSTIERLETELGGTESNDN